MSMGPIPGCGYIVSLKDAISYCRKHFNYPKLFEFFKEFKNVNEEEIYLVYEDFKNGSINLNPQENEIDLIIACLHNFIREQFPLFDLIYLPELEYADGEAEPNMLFLYFGEVPPTEEQRKSIPDFILEKLDSGLSKWVVWG